MTNYYEELQLEQGVSAEEIHKRLIALQRTWIQRQINIPDKASEKLLLINEALEIFKTEASKKNYDKELEEYNTPKQETADNSADKERIQKLLQFRKEVTRYFGESKFDLAKVAIDNALKYYNADTDEIYYREYSFMAIAATIYHEYGDEKGALRFNNEAIVKCPEEDVDTQIENYATRAEIYLNFLIKRAQTINNVYVDNQAMNFFNEAKESARKAYNLLNQASDDVNNDMRIEYILLLAEILSYTNEKSAEAPQAFSEARRLAESAIQMGDNSGRAREIIESCKEASERKEVYKKQMEELDKQTEEFKQRRVQEQTVENGKKSVFNKVKWVGVGLFAVCAIVSIFLGQWFNTILGIGICIWIYKSIERKN